MFLTASCLLAPGAARAQVTPGRGLTADETARRAIASSHDIAASRQDVEASRAAVSAAKAGYVPRVQGYARYTRLSDVGPQLIGNLVAAEPGTPPGPLPPGAPLLNVPVAITSLVDQYALGASLTIPLSDYFLRTAPAVDAAEMGHRASELELSASERDVELNARRTYYVWARAVLNVGVAEDALATASGHLGDARNLQAAGSLSRADVLRVESSVAQAQLGVVRARSAAEVAATRLHIVLHDDGRTPLVMGEDMFADLPGAEEDIAVLTRRALESRPELRALAHRAAATRRRAAVQRAGYLPRLDLVGDATYADPNPRIFPQKDEFHGTWDVSAVLTWTPSDFFGTTSAVRETEARAAQLEARRQSAADGVRIEVESAWQAVKEARQAIETTTLAVTTAEESYRVRRAQFQNGRATSLELTDTELEQTRARFDAIDARIQLRVARAALRHAVGAP